MLPKDFWGRVWFLLQQYSGSYLKGAGQTMLIALVGTLAGCIIGFVVGVIQTIPKDRKEQPVRWLLTSILQFAMNAYVEVFRGTPMMAQAMFIFYGLAMVWNIHLPTLAAALLAVLTAALTAAAALSGSRWTALAPAAGCRSSRITGHS